MLKYIYSIIIAIGLFGLNSCSPSPDLSGSLLDSGQISYNIPDSLEKHLVSKYISSPTNVQKNTPVIIAAHGYSATTFEWEELREYADSAKTFFVSQVLLGGHGTSYSDFKKASWEDWQQSIKEEYVKLSNMGFTKIYLVGSSTGAPLIINILKSGFFNNYQFPKGIFLVDPIIISANKALTLVGTAGPILGYTSVEMTAEEEGKWYVYRPYESLQQLQELLDLTRRDLQKGIALRDDLFVKVYKSKTDDVADPVSALLIYKGLKYDWILYKNIEVELVNSNLHVFTRLRARDGVSAADIALQHKVFAEMEDVMTR